MSRYGVMLRSGGGVRQRNATRPAGASDTLASISGEMATTMATDAGTRAGSGGGRSAGSENGSEASTNIGGGALSRGEARAMDALAGSSAASRATRRLGGMAPKAP